MRFGPVQMKDKLGRTVVMRNAEKTDAEALIRYLKITSGETPFLLREPEEVTLTIGQEERFVQGIIDAERELMLVAAIDGEQVGNCSLMSKGPFKRYHHRCEVAIALYQTFCGAGIGEMMMREVLEAAKHLGYEQAELEVMADNAGAIALYNKLGFETCGLLPHSMKYGNGTYADALWMVKRL